MSDRNEWFKDVKRLARNLEVETWDEESVVREQLRLAEKGGED